MFANIKDAPKSVAKHYAISRGCKPTDITLRQSNRIVTIVGNPNLSYKRVFDVLAPDNEFLGRIVIIGRPNAHGYECHKVSEQGIACPIPIDM